MQLSGALDIYNQERSSNVPFVYIDNIGSEHRIEREKKYPTLLEECRNEHWQAFLNNTHIDAKAQREALGNRRNRLRSYNENPDVASRLAVRDICLSGSLDEITKAAVIFDAQYHIPSGEPPKRILDSIVARDKNWTEKLRSAEGVVVLGCGIGHIFGEYHNIYDQLKAQNLEVTRSSLLDHAPPILERPGIHAINHNEYIELVNKVFRRLNDQ